MGEGQGHHIGLGEQAIQRTQTVNLVKALCRAARAPAQPNNPLCPQGADQPGKVAADIAGTAHQHGFARQGANGSKIRPDMGPLLVPVGGQALIDGQEHGKHVFRHGWAVGSHGGGEAHALRQNAGDQIGVHPRVPALHPFQVGKGLELFGGDIAQQNGGALPPLLGMLLAPPRSLVGRKRCSDSGAAA